MHLLKFMNTPKVCCQIIRKLHHSIVFIYLVSKNASICIVFAVCVLLFSYELHRRIGLMDKANNHVSVMYASLHNVRIFFLPRGKTELSYSCDLILDSVSQSC